MIAVYYSPESMTEAQYREVSGRVQGLGIEFNGFEHHSCFGEGDQLAVYEIWRSREDWDEFARHLMPIVDDVGVKMRRPPDVMPVVAMGPE